ncbi:MAG: hypothetical protein FGF53_07055 [Candidatus Brockarchaeota archaeon]|nr:hypothetical protein [Candidatus Brockarchaeota archaeon]MBO3808828.1 hypothetical protein [Candidatus Brockarchaeota archaeon]
MSNIPLETKILLPSIPVYNDMEERWSTSPTWLSLIPRKYYVEVEELKPLETDKNDSARYLSLRWRKHLSMRL